MGLLITAILGVFIFIGAIIVVLSRNNDRFVDFSISLAFGVMIMICFTDLFPEVTGIFKSEVGGFKGVFFSFLLICFGLLVLKVLDIFIPDHEGSDKEELVHIGLISSIALVLHNIIEGMAIYTSVNASLKTGILVSIGVGLHNIPLGMVIASTFFKAKENTKKSWLIISLISLSTFIGGLIMFAFSGILINELILGIILCITLGMIIYISIFELLPKIIEMKNKKIALLGIVLGILLITITVFI